MAGTGPQERSTSSRTRAGRALNSPFVLLVAFAFAVMGDPVSSVAYAIEAPLRALHGDLSLLLPTMAVVIAVVTLVILNYHQLVGRFPKGGGAAAAAGSAFGEGWAFLPLGSLVVDFVLTIAISVAAGASAIIAYVPRLAPARLPLGLALLLVVAGLTWFGHGGRTVFAAMTIAFVAVASVILVVGFVAPHGSAPPTVVTDVSPHGPPLSILLAFPVAMALSTGIEAPSSAIAQLGQLDDAGRRRFGRITLWLTLAIVGWLTLGLTALAVRLHVGIPAPHSTQVADIAQAAVGRRGLYAVFQLSSALLLLAAASSSFQAGPGLLKALAQETAEPGDGTGSQRSIGLLPAWLGVTNRHHTPYLGVVVFLAISAVVVISAGGQDQELVLFYAVAVFISFLAGLLAMGRFSRRDRRFGFLVVNLVAALLVGLTLVLNLARVYPIASLAAASAIAGWLYWLWVRAGRPTGVSQIDRISEEELGEEEELPAAVGPVAGIGDG